MNQHIVISAMGQDQVGIVDKITAVLLKHNANLEDSRMARLGGEFAAIILVEIPTASIEPLNQELETLKQQELSITCKTTKPLKPQGQINRVPYEITVKGADQEGIVHRVAHYLAQNDINIESLDTGLVNAPITGTPLFSMHAVVQCPVTHTLIELRRQLTQIADDMGTDLEVKPKF